MAAAFALAIFSGKIIFIFANLENLRIFQICFFTEKVVTINGICRAGFLWERSCSRKRSWDDILDGSIWLLSTSPNFSVKIVRTAND